MRPHRRQPTRLPCPWDSPGKNTGVGCHFLLQCMKVKSESEVARSCLTLSDPMDCSLPDFSLPGIFQARVLEWGAIAFSEYICIHIYVYMGFPGGKESACKCRRHRRHHRFDPWMEGSTRKLWREDLLEEGIATHSNILAWRIPWREDLGRYSP